MERTLRRRSEIATDQSMQLEAAQDQPDQDTASAQLQPPLRRSLRLQLASTAPSQPSLQTPNRRSERIRNRNKTRLERASRSSTPQTAISPTSGLESSSRPRLCQPQPTRISEDTDFKPHSPVDALNTIGTGFVPSTGGSTSHNDDTLLPLVSVEEMLERLAANQRELEASVAKLLNEASKQDSDAK